MQKYNSKDIRSAIKKDMQTVIGKCGGCGRAVKKPDRRIFERTGLCWQCERSHNKTEKES